MSAPRRRFGYPPMRQLRMIDRAHVERLALSIGQPPPALADIKAIWSQLQATGQAPHSKINGQTRPVAIVDAQDDDALADWIDVLILKASNEMGVSVTDLYVGLTDVQHDGPTGRSWCIMGLAT